MITRHGRRVLLRQGKGLRSGWRKSLVRCGWALGVGLLLTISAHAGEPPSQPASADPPAAPDATPAPSAEPAATGATDGPSCDEACGSKVDWTKIPPVRPF